jgi:hypothetical protein
MSHKTACASRLDKQDEKMASRPDRLTFNVRFLTSAKPGHFLVFLLFLLLISSHDLRYVATMRRVLVFIPLVSFALVRVTSIQLFQSSGNISRLSVVITSNFRDRRLIDSLQQSLAVAVAVAGEVDHVSSAKRGLVAVA